MGAVEVPDSVYYGAQTARALHYFRMGEQRMPLSVIRALALLKRAAAEVNYALGKLSKVQADVIIAAAQEVVDGKHVADFPISIWQTGSGTQTNMNGNEVIANRATEMLGGKLGSKLIHPNDHVNMGQSSNDVFPTVMHLAAVDQIRHLLLPALSQMCDALQKKVEEYRNIIKIGRTHLMDAVPLTLGQEFSGYVAMLKEDIERIQFSLKHLSLLAIGGTAVGTGLNTAPEFGEMVCAKLSEFTDWDFQSSPNKFAALASHGAVAFASSALRGVACSLIKIANDIRWMGSGPRCGLHELILPANEPGSSIMPGKVNPTQCESMTMACGQVIGNDQAVGFGASQGNFELNVYKPLIINNFLSSLTLLSESCRDFREHLLAGIRVNKTAIQQHLQNSLMLVTCLTPKIGYDRAAEIAKLAHEEGILLREANQRLGYLSDREFDALVRPEKMIAP
jgi:fumarate hydratase class II